ncbi:GerAB/ArcD/ProY family transporter [Cohnella sp. GCM10012308]|uniref:GerAB/ArcD/ProY family transporter n=1 Tax=Cohnella sp. GCM10012308 TaxID=3317329 RepID=UPI00360A3FC0
MVQYSRYQLSALIILFQIGSSSLFLLASDAKRDAWIATLFAMLVGFGLLALVTLTIQKLAPRQNLIDILLAYFGRYAGTALSISYVLYFSYKSIRNFREFSDLTIVYLLPQTPLIIVLLLLILLSAYAVYQGLEVFFRLAEVLLPVVLLVYGLLIFLLIGGDIVHLDRLLPVMEGGVRPVFDAAIPEVISFPFGEMVVFLMLWPYCNDRKMLSRVTMISYLFAGFFIVVTNMAIIGSLGPVSQISSIPFMMGTSFIQIASIIERMDPFVALLLFTGVFIKQTTYFLAATLAASRLLNLRHRAMILPVGLAIFGGSLLFRSQMAQVWIGFKYNLKYHFPIFQIAIPLLLLLVMLTKNRRLKVRA